jgi:CubicO group peptidase (beta-lactamase class C family)
VGKSGNRILSKAGVKLMSANHLPAEILPDFIKSGIAQAIGYGYGYGVRTNLDPALGNNLSPVGEFGWDGARGSYFSCDPKNKVAFFYAEHMGGLHPVILPRLRNVVYSCLDL